MIELVELALLGLCSFIEWVLNSGLDSQEATLAECCKCFSTMFGSHSNTIDCCLSNSCILRISMGTDLLHNLWIDRTQEAWSQELDHVIKNEEQEFRLGFAGVLGNLWKDFRDEFLDKRLACIFVGLEHHTKELCQGQLKLILVFIFFFEHNEIFFIEPVLFVSFSILLFVFGVFR